MPGVVGFEALQAPKEPFNYLQKTVPPKGYGCVVTNYVISHFSKQDYRLELIASQIIQAVIT